VNAIDVLIRVALEVTFRHSSGGYDGLALTDGADMSPLVVDHEEEFVSAVIDFGEPDGAVQLESVIVPLEREHLGRRRLIGEKIRIGIHVIVADVLIQGTVITVRATLAEHVNLRRLVAILRRIHAGLNLELLNAIDR